MKKNGILHRISTAVLAGAMLLSLASCGASNSQTPVPPPGKSPAPVRPKALKATSSWK